MATWLHRRDILAAAGLSLVPTRVLCAPTAPSLVCGLLDVPPWIIRDGDAVTGIAADTIRHVARGAGMDIRIEVAPHARLALAFREGHLDLLIFLPSLDLEAVGQVLGRVGKVEVGVILSREFSPASAADFAGRQIGTMRGGATSSVWAAIPDARRQDVNDIGQGLAMIAGGRLDGFLGSRQAMEWHFRQSRTDPARYGGFFPIQTQFVQLYATHRRDWAPAVLARLKAACIDTEAAYDSICANYLTRV